MEKYEVLLYPKAFRDIEEIYAYLAYSRMEPAAAKNQTDRIWKAIKDLDTFPAAHQNRLEGKYAGKDYKQLIVDHYLVLFKIDEQHHRVYVVTIQYQGRNI